MKVRLCITFTLELFSVGIELPLMTLYKSRASTRDFTLRFFSLFVIFFREPRYANYEFPPIRARAEKKNVWKNMNATIRSCLRIWSTQTFPSILTLLFIYWRELDSHTL